MPAKAFRDAFVRAYTTQGEGPSTYVYGWGKGGYALNRPANLG